MQVKNNEGFNSGSLKGDLVHYIQVTAIYRFHFLEKVRHDFREVVL